MQLDKFAHEPFDPAGTGGFETYDEPRASRKRLIDDAD